jgi:uncharacterized protein YdhG (YjbR/CyaY superfamily)
VVTHRSLLGSWVVGAWMPSRMVSTPRTVDDSLAEVPPPLRRALQQLRATIRSAAPQATELISYRIPAIRQNGVLVYDAAYTDHLSFFPGRALVRRRFAAELRAFDGGKGTFRFTPENPIPSGLVTQIVKLRLKEDVARKPRPPRARPPFRGSRPCVGRAKRTS